jgi:hypothetical protein
MANARVKGKEKKFEDVGRHFSAYAQEKMPKDMSIEKLDSELEEMMVSQMG